MKKNILIITLIGLVALVAVFYFSCGHDGVIAADEGGIALDRGEGGGCPGGFDGPPGMPPPHGMDMKGPGGPGGMRGPAPKLEQQDIERTEKFLKEYDPVKYKEVQEIKAKDPVIYGRIVAGIFRDMQFLERIKKENPEVFKCMVEERALESQCRELGKSLEGEKDQAKIRKIKDELRSRLAKMFDLRQIAQGDRIKHIEKEIVNMKKKQEERLRNRDRIIDRRLQMMTDRSEGLEW